MNDEFTLEFYDALDDCLDALLSGERTLDECLALYPEYADELKLDLQAAVLASRLKSPAMATERVDALESQLRGIMASEMEAPAPSKIIAFRPPMLLSRAAAIVLIALVIVLGSGGGVVAASADSMPGETLYPVKRLWESIILVLASITGQLDDAWLQLAETRFKEAQFSVEHDALTPEMIDDLWNATQNAIEYAGDSPELQAYLTVLAANLQSEALIETSNATHAQFITLIVPVLESFPVEMLTPDPQVEAIDVAGTATIQAEPTITLTPTRNVVSASATGVTGFNANTQLTATIQATEVRNTATATSRIPPTPTRTPTPTTTSTVTPQVVIPSATITPLPPPTQVIRPTVSQGGTAIPPTAIYNPGEPTAIPTWFPYIRLTEEAFYLTRTAQWQGTNTP